ncbi:MAG: IS200/IS605 family transposase [Proteobacteria bacterium]|nr:IS200/IS605 family transposase [Pseudomonadota bacterium]
MKQRHSYTNFVYHMVFRTKHREHFISSLKVEEALKSFLKAKAHHLDAYILEMGGWREHMHLLIRTRSTMALSDVYGRLKGFSSRAWHKQFPDLPFAWADGVYAVTVDPENTTNLKAYIRSQRVHHEHGTTVDAWEPKE